MWRGTFCWKPHLNWTSGYKVMSNWRILKTIKHSFWLCLKINAPNFWLIPLDFNTFGMCHIVSLTDYLWLHPREDWSCQCTWQLWTGLEWGKLERFVNINGASLFPWKHLPISQREYFAIHWFNLRGWKVNSLLWKFKMQYLQSLS